MKLRRHVFLVVFGLLCLGATAAHAESSTARAKRLFEDGLTNYNLGHYQVALDAFEAGYKLRHDAAFLYNIGQCQRQLRHYDEAQRAYRAYLRESPNLPAGTRDQVQKLVAEMERALEEKQAAAPEPAAPAPAAVAAAPKPSEPKTVDVVAAAPTVRAQPRRPFYRKTAGMVITCVGLGVAIAGGALMGVAGSNASNAEHASTLPEQRRFNDDAGTFSTAGASALGLGGALMVAGIITLAVQK